MLTNWGRESTLQGRGAVTRKLLDTEGDGESVVWSEGLSISGAAVILQEEKGKGLEVEVCEDRTS